MSRICPLFSGSTGNSTYLGYKDTGILIDVGMSCKSVVTALQNIDCAAEEIKAIAITHEHTYHIKGLKTFLKKSGAMLLPKESRNSIKCFSSSFLISGLFMSSTASAPPKNTS